MRILWDSFSDDEFLSTPSARRATSLSSFALRSSSNFYPRPPRGGRRRPLRLHPPHTHISIHALREEGDLRLMYVFVLGTNFYPRPPRGGRPQSECDGA